MIELFADSREPFAMFYFLMPVAIPAVIEKFSPSFEAGNGYWSYELALIAIEQLVGL